jgi:hypothetical protein
MKNGETLNSLLEAEGFDGDDSLVEAIVGESVDFKGRTVEECMALVAKLVERKDTDGWAGGVGGFRVDGF